MKESFRHKNIGFESREGVGIIEIDNAPINFITTDMYKFMTTLLGVYAHDEDVKKILICGANGRFTDGNDLNNMLWSHGGDQITEERLKPMFNFLVALSEMRKQVVSGIQGACRGIGSVIAAFSDVVIANENAEMGFSFSKVGIPMEAGFAKVFPSTVPSEADRQSILKKGWLTAVEAEEFGFIDKLVAEDLDRDTLLKIAGQYGDRRVRYMEEGLKSEIRGGIPDIVKALNTAEVQQNIRGILKDAEAKYPGVITIDI